MEKALFYYSFKADILHIEPLRVRFESYLKENTKLSEKNIDLLNICLDEAITNTIVHSFKEKNIQNGFIEVHSWIKNTNLWIEITDNGETYNPLEKYEDKGNPKDIYSNLLKNNIQEGKNSGLGVAIYLKFMDNCQYSRTPDNKNKLQFRKNL